MPPPPHAETPAGTGVWPMPASAKERGGANLIRAPPSFLSHSMQLPDTNRTPDPYIQQAGSLLQIINHGVVVGGNLCTMLCFPVVGSNPRPDLFYTDSFLNKLGRFERRLPCTIFIHSSNAVNPVSHTFKIVVFNTF